MAEAVRKTQCGAVTGAQACWIRILTICLRIVVLLFMCYGIAWGLRNEYLAKRTYKPVLEKGWKSLVKAVHTDGKLGYIQPVGAASQGCRT